MSPGRVIPKVCNEATCGAVREMIDELLGPPAATIDAQVGLYPIVTLGKQLLNMIGNLLVYLARLSCTVK